MGYINVSELTGAVQGLVRILRAFPREIRVVAYSYARLQRHQQWIQSGQLDASTCSSTRRQEFLVSGKAPMPNPIPTLCSQHDTTPSRIAPTLLWVSCGSCSGE